MYLHVDIYNVFVEVIGFSLDCIGLDLGTNGIHIDFMEESKKNLKPSFQINID